MNKITACKGGWNGFGYNLFTSWYWREITRSKDTMYVACLPIAKFLKGEFVVIEVIIISRMSHSFLGWCRWCKILTSRLKSPPHLLPTLDLAVWRHYSWRWCHWSHNCNQKNYEQENISFFSTCTTARKRWPNGKGCRLIFILLKDLIDGSMRLTNTRRCLDTIWRKI